MPRDNDRAPCTNSEHAGKGSKFCRDCAKDGIINQKRDRLLLRMAAHQLRMGQVLAIMGGQGTAGGETLAECAAKLGEQNYFLSRAIEETA